MPGGPERERGRQSPVVAEPAGATTGRLACDVHDARNQHHGGHLTALAAHRL
ncbi:hypothetical protein ABZ927_36795 [Streptomyces massasporeus]